MDTTFFNTVDMTCCIIVSITNTVFIMCQSQQVMLAIVKNVASLEAQLLACACPTHVRVGHTKYTSACTSSLCWEKKYIYIFLLKQNIIPK